MDTIYAVSSGAPPAAIAVLRISGARAFDAVRALAGRLPAPRRASLCSLRDPADSTLLDRALVLVFPSPETATGEDLAELHLHGGRAVVRAVERALAVLPGMRAAAAGEFTRRALAHGRLDLSEAEGLGDLLAAETESQRRVAIRSAEGGVRRAVEAWSAQTLDLAAQVEALLDHSDEDDVSAEALTLSALQAEARAIGQAIEAVTARPPVERLRDGLRVVLAGPPNAGKSTLLNALAGREAAIVSPVAGTTRDRIEVPLVRDGLAYVFTDTAGLSDAPGDAIEAIGIARAREALGGADLLLWLGDDAPPETPPGLWLHARADAPGRGVTQPGQVAVSAATGMGIDAVWEGLAELGGALVPPPDLIALNQRQRALCAAAGDALRRATGQDDLLLLAEELRTALRCFDAVTGRAGVEAMLDSLFARFCIGK
ncbi:tRNA uridine-5-carboxymethylaminomethyl(34) synthesis GTPase MnmE [Sphingomonas hengshuiensis]|uniref:tRNA modification GTPase MnmE n=1 Tax=Sphingomonas hengshuiensis TaxID=1609977 RepID=A0A7U4JB69_9SPHN|nr:tRNA uridine-5-carboxymethylaminomethyl(34) synthesis GTPase MnmE [Sphingomonas hengshuiensis]AJP73606.1 tRNA modification GTPase TrmE [Sphingomonas hengshuiensis]